MSLDSKDPARRLAKQLNCPTCSRRPESFFADGTVCPTCGRKKSLLLEALSAGEVKTQDQLKRDTERLDWLESNPRHAKIIIDGVPTDCVFYGISCAELTRLRDAVDAAMGAQS